MRLRTLASTALFCLAVSTVQAQTSYTGSDNAAGPSDPRPNSNTAAAQFDAAAALFGGAQIMDFENLPAGAFASRTPATGVTLTGMDYTGGQLSIGNAPDYPPMPELSGFNTTSGGSQYVNLEGGFATFTFASPIQGFGAYFTGVQPGFFQSVLTYNDGTTHTMNLPSASSMAGGVSFLGFIDPGKSITQIVITADDGVSNADFIGIDDVRFVPTVADTPEPGTVGLLAGASLSATACLLRRRRRRRQA